MNNDIYILLLDVLKSVIGILVFTMLTNIYALYIIIKNYRKDKKEPVIISYDKFNKGQGL